MSTREWEQLELFRFEDSRPKGFRGFLAELEAERRGNPTYPLWRDMPMDPAFPDTKRRWR